MNENEAGPPTAVEETDEQLMAAFACGSSEAFNALFARYRQPIYGFFCRRVADRSLAEELSQETFLAVLRAQNRYEATALFRTWLYAIALRILSANRRKAAFRAIFAGSLPDAGEPAAQATSDAAIIVREAIRKLDRIDREILLLREFEELSYSEIAAVLRIPVNTVRSRLFRARTALRELLLSARPAEPRAGLLETEEHA